MEQTARLPGLATKRDSGEIDPANPSGCRQTAPKGMKASLSPLATVSGKAAE
jgi:hypothetical protein